jgi:hypothetical protein
MKPSIVYCLLLFISVSCGKSGIPSDHDDSFPIDPTDNSYPVVTVSSPTDDQVYTSGSTVNVMGTVSDNSLYQGSISIRNEANGLVVKDQYYEIHYIPSYNFSMSCPITVTTPTDFTVSVKFEDHGRNITARTVNIKVNP